MRRMAPNYDMGTFYGEPDLSIDWGLNPSEIRVSDKDNALPYFRVAKIVDM
jgi:dTDP-4-dehydrorhamnose 3,5-epimerase-like enzyme